MIDTPANTYLDSNVFIYAVEGTADIAGPARELLQFFRKRPGTAVTSEITFAEVLSPPQRPGAMPLHMKRRVYVDLLIWSGFIELAPVTRGLLIETADLRSVARMKLPDAIHLVSAIHAHCRFLVSRDSDFKMLPTGMSFIPLHRESISELLRTLA